MINILIPEEMPALNKGEAAILAGMLESFKLLRDDVRVTMFSIYPEDDEPRYVSQAEIIDARGVMPSHMISASSNAIKKMFEFCTLVSKHLSFAILYLVLGYHATKIMKRKTWTAYSKADVVIICHDSLFYPLYHPIVTLFSRALSKRVVIYGATFNLDVREGRFLADRRRLAEWSMKLVFRNADLITLREELSYELVRDIGVNSIPVHVTGDFPFLLEPAREERVNQILRAESLENWERMVGFSIGQHKMGVFLSHVSDFKERYNKFVEIMTEVVDHLTTSLHATVVFIPHCVGHGPKLDDRIISAEIYRKTRHKDRVHVITHEYPPEDLKGLAGQFEMFIGMRLHSVVDAVSMGVPSIMLTHPHDSRANGILGRMLGLDQWLYDLKSLTARGLLERINELWHSREQVRADLERSVQEVRKHTMLNGAPLAKLLNAGRRPDACLFGRRWASTPETKTPVGH